MKKLITAVSAAFSIVLLFAIYSCNESGTFDEIEAIRSEEEAFRPDVNQREPEWDYSYESGTDISDDGCYTDEYRLYAGQSIDVGSVTYSTDDTYLYVTYATDGDWYLKETHLYVGCPGAGSPNDGIPSNNPGNPVIGHFPFTADHNPMVQSYTYKIIRKDLGCDDCYIIATHAKVIKLGSGGREIQDETAFQECTEGTIDFEGNRWGCYYEWCPEECEEDYLYASSYKMRLPENSSCYTFEQNNNLYYAWSTKYSYDWLKSIDYVTDLPLFLNPDMCKLENSQSITEVGRIEIALSKEDPTELTITYYIEDGYSLKNIELYVGLIDIPLKLDGSLNDGVKETDFVRREFISNEKVHSIQIPWTGTGTSVDQKIWISARAELSEI